jgi:SPP1 family predicted phage head-tail adaptor
MINAYLQDSMEILTVTYDKWGTATTVSTSIKGRFNYKTQMVRNLEGEQVVSNAFVLIPATEDINNEDKIKYNGKEYNILSLELAKDFSDRFIKVNLK